MKKILLIGLVSLSLSGCSGLAFLTPKKAALQIYATPSAAVYLNGTKVGDTPYFDDKLKPGEYDVRMVVASDPAKDWSTKAVLNPQIVTVINRLFGLGLNDSSNYLLQLEPLPSKNSSELSIITVPDNVIVKIDGQPEGFSPVSKKDIGEGEHSVLLSAPGYQEMTVQAQTKKGYKLIVAATLAHASLDTTTLVGVATPSAGLQPTTATKSATPTPKTTPKPTAKATPTPTLKAGVTPTLTPKATSSGSTSASGSANLARPYVQILTTPTGWLRVRSEPTDTTDNEVAKVTPGEQYKYLESNDTGWYKIEYETGQTGWISAKYAQLYK